MEQFTLQCLFKKRYFPLNYIIKTKPINISIKKHHKKWNGLLKVLDFDYHKILITSLKTFYAFKLLKPWFKSIDRLINQPINQSLLKSLVTWIQVNRLHLQTHPNHSQATPWILLQNIFKGNTKLMEQPLLHFGKIWD